MNKKTIVLLASLLLVVVIYFVLRRNTGNTLTGSDRNFEFASTDQIDKVFIVNKQTRDYVLLKKTGRNEWSVNDSFKANVYQLDILFETFRKIRVKRPASKHEINHIKKTIALSGTKVEIYEKGSLSKVFYVGGNTSDEMGTFFLMENAKEPYVCHIPGFNGYLNARFYTKTEAWRSKSIFKLKDNEIKTVDLKWAEMPAESFSINNEGKEPELQIGGQSQANNTGINLNSLKSYLKLWENLSFEGFPIDLDAGDIDSIARTAPLLTIRVADKYSNITELRIHKKGIKRDSNIQLDDMGNPLKYDIETFYAFVNGNFREVVQIQDYVFGKVMKKGSDFLLQK